jgi:AcrR family transcriptional regulator
MTAGSSRPKANPKAGLTPAIVVTTAADLADEHGLAAVTVSSVARALGVRPPSIYSHLGGASDVVAGVTRLALDELADLVDRAIAGLAGRDALTALADTHRAYARAHPGRFAAAGLLDVDVTPELAAAGARHREQALAVLRGYAVPPGAQVHAVRLVGSTVRGFVELEAGGAFAHDATDTDESWRWAVAALDLALADSGT